MAYATIADVQARIPVARLTLGPASEPSAGTVESWLDAQSDWIDASLSARYAVPVTAPMDCALVREACAGLVAARVWTLLDGSGTGLGTGMAAELRREALQLLGYSERTGRSELTLCNTAAAVVSGPAPPVAAAPPEGRSLFERAMEF